LNNSQIAAKAREMMAAGIDRSAIAAWVKEQQAFQNAAAAQAPAPAPVAAQPTPAARPMPQTNPGRGMPNNMQPTQAVKSMRFISLFLWLSP